MKRARGEIRVRLRRRKEGGQEEKEYLAAGFELHAVPSARRLLDLLHWALAVL
jgi:hypothetical protein